MLDEVAVRPLPESPEAEASLLGALLLDPERLAEVRDRVRPDDFSREAHRKIYGAIAELAERNVAPSFQSVSDLLRERGALEDVGGAAALVALIEATPASAHVRGYAAVVERTAVLRRIIRAAQDIARLALTRSDASEALQRAQQLLFEIGESRLHREVVSVGRALRELFETIELQNERGIERALPTGFRSLDELLGGGLHPGDLVVVAGRPGLGKTTLALNVARNAALVRDAKCAIFSLEMTEEDLTLRLLSSLAEIDGGRLRRGALDEDELQAISQASSQLMRRGIFIEEATRLTVPDILAHARKLQAREGLDLMVIDYLQLMEGARAEENRVQEVGGITRGLKAVARELNVPVVVLSQLSRQIERRTGGEPKLSDLRECVAGDTRVIDADTGRWVEVRSLRAGMRLLAVDESQRIGPFTLADVWSTGVRPVFRLTSQSGRQIRATSNHPFLTPQGWKRLEELRSDDLVATAMRLPKHGVERHERADQCRLLGYLAGDGTHATHRAVGFISSDNASFEDVMRIIQRQWPEVQARMKHRPGDNWLEADFVKLYDNGFGRPYGNPMREWLRSIGLVGQTDRNKRVPDFVFESGEIGASSFLAGYLSTDGCVKTKIEKGRTRWAVHFDTISHGLALDVQALLLRLRVASVVEPATFYSKSTVPIYRLLVGEKNDNLRRLAKALPVCGRKGGLLSRFLLEYRAAKETNPGIYALPRHLSAHLASLDIGWRDQRKRMRRSTALDYAQRTGDEVPRTYAESDLLWESIRSIEPVGEEEVFDLRVPASGNFLANGIVVHNSGAIEQDADIVVFLWRRERDRVDPHEVPVLDVRLAKHRNGPTGDFRLVFEHEYSRFRESAA